MYHKRNTLQKNRQGGLGVCFPSSKDDTSVTRHICGMVDCKLSEQGTNWNLGKSSTPYSHYISCMHGFAKPAIISYTGGSNIALLFRDRKNVSLISDDMEEDFWSYTVLIQCVKI